MSSALSLNTCVRKALNRFWLQPAVFVTLNVIRKRASVRCVAQCFGAVSSISSSTLGAKKKRLQAGDELK